jgi:hypothetical protein
MQKSATTTSTAFVLKNKPINTGTINTKADFEKALI